MGFLDEMEKTLDVLEESKKEKMPDPKAKVRNKPNPVFEAGSKYVKDDKDHFPLGNEAQARNALARANQYSAVPSWFNGSLSLLKKKVADAVKRKYKGIEVTKKATD